MTTPFINATLSASWISPITSTTTSPFTTSLKSTSMESTRTSIFSTHFSLKSTPPLSPTHLNTDTTAIRKVTTTNIFTQISTRPPSPATTQIPSLKILTDVSSNFCLLFIKTVFYILEVRIDIKLLKQSSHLKKYCNLDTIHPKCFIKKYIIHKINSNTPSPIEPNLARFHITKDLI
uniref:Uncharacterized protein n=1 Tax=Heterorhabditis bacteriophora TaxID=37862 RepID=A0A1I7WYX8_HETBA